LVTHDATRQRYEARLDGELIGHATCTPSGGAVIIGHTEVDRRHESRGVGAAIIKAALEDLRARGLQVLPLCSFAAAYIRRHREYADLVPGERRAQFRL
jgi:predicted GNAT family acetyltransferase